MRRLVYILGLIILLFAIVNIKFSEKKINYKKETAFDMPEAPAIRDFEMMKDPSTGTIPYEKYPVAMAQTKIVRRSSLSQTLTWTQIPVNMGGRTKTLCVDPNDPTHHKLWAGSATGGLWVNQDISNSDTEWTPVGDVWETLSINSIVFDPNNSQIMYVGTGEYETAIVDMYRESSGRGYGIWKSTDDGQTFQRLLSTSDFSYISDLAVKNENGQSVIYAGVVSGTYRGADFTAQPSEGLYRSTDGGQSWTQVLPQVPGTGEVFAVSDIEITGSGRIFVGTKRNFNDNGGGYILYSDTGDPGSWTLVNQFAQQISSGQDYNIPGRVKLASAPSNANKIYAVFAAKSTQQTIEGFPQTIGKIIATSDNAGQTWQERGTPSGLSESWAYLAWHALAITVDPTDENRAFVGGLDNHFTTNSGDNWQQISDWQALYYGGGSGYVHGDIHKILFLSNTSNNELVFATDGGVFYTDSAQVNNNIFFQSRNKSYSTLQFYSVAINTIGQEFIAGGLQDNGTVGYQGSPMTEMDMIQGGDGAFCKFDTNEPLIITSTYDNQFKITNYQSYDENWIYSYSSGLFVSTFDYDSQNNIIWTVASDLHDNRLNQVLKLTDIQNGENGNYITLPTNATKYFSAIKLLDADSFLIGTANGHLYKVSNINSTPTAVELGNTVFPDAFISGIATADNGQRILITLSNYGVESVWQSTDAGQNWQNVESNLPDIPVRWAIYHPDNPHQVMLATETGIWTTDNIDANPVVWQPADNSLPNVRVDMLDVNPNTLKVVAGTHGRGLFTTTWTAINSVQEDKVVNNFKIYPNPARDIVHIELDDLATNTIQIYDINGNLIKEFTIKKSAFSFSVADLSPGIYLVKNGISFNKLIVKK